MAYNITYLNQIVADLGGSDTYIYEIDALNAICTLLGVTAGHTYKIDALNAIEVNQGGSGGHKYNIDALNSIITLAGETGGYKYEPDAWAVIQQGALLNQFDALAPSDLLLTVLSDTSIKLDWTNNSVNADGHAVERSLDGVTYTEITTVLGATATLTDTGLTDYTRYYYRVRAYKSTSYSDYCTAQNAYTKVLQNNRIGHYDASVLTGLNDGDTVASFTDISGNNRHLTQSDNTKRPLYKTNIINSLPVVQSDGVDDWMRIFPQTINQPYSVYSILAKTGGSGFIAHAFNNGQLTINSATRISTNSGTNLQVDTTPAATNIPFIATTVLNGANSVISYNGGGPTKEGNAGTQNGDRIHLFSDSGGDVFMSVNQGELIIYSGAHNATQRRRIESYLADKWGITLESGSLTEDVFEHAEPSLIYVGA